MKILIVEDEEVLAEVLKKKFTDEGYEISIAKDGAEAVPMVRKILPDIVLLDLILPKKHGLVVLEELKSDPKLSQIPVIILSNLAEDENIKKALDFGAFDYFVKAQHPLDEIVKKISSAFANNKKKDKEK